MLNTFTRIPIHRCTCHISETLRPFPAQIMPLCRRTNKQYSTRCFATSINTVEDPANKWTISTSTTLGNARYQKTRTHCIMKRTYICTQAAQSCKLLGKLMRVRSQKHAIEPGPHEMNCAIVLGARRPVDWYRFRVGDLTRSRNLKIQASR